MGVVSTCAPVAVAAATSDAARDAWRRVVRDIDGGASIANALKKEQQFFKTHPA